MQKEIYYNKDKINLTLLKEGSSTWGKSSHENKKYLKSILS